MKKCEICGHSRAAHTDGVKCALCDCISRPRELVQESFGFRGPLLRPPQSGRKR